MLQRGSELDSPRRRTVRLRKAQKGKRAVSGHLARLYEPGIRNGPRGSLGERFASDLCVTRFDGAWIVFYFGLSEEGLASESLTLGSEPYHLSKVNQVLIDVGPPGTIDDRLRPQAVSAGAPLMLMTW
jgi:hypothetical protein